MKFLHSFSLFWLGVAAACAAPKPITIKMASDAKDGMVRPGAKVSVTATIHNRGKEAVTGLLDWKLHSVAFEVPAGAATKVTLGAGGKREFRFSFRMKKSGFADAECRLATEGGKTYHGRRRTGSDPESIRILLTREPDFVAFWKRSLAEMAKVSPDFQVVAVPERNKDGIEVFEVTMRSFGDVTVRGWLEVPTVSGPHPVVIRVPGYGGNMKPIGKWKDMMVFSFNPRAHGTSQDQVKGKPVDYWVRGLDDKDTYYYRGAYLDCIRAIDYVASRKDVDSSRIAVWGGSQGGGFAFAMAALDARVDACVPDIPFLCDWVNYFKLTHWPEMDKWIAAKPERTWESTLRTLSYFDTMNLADRTTCPTFMSIGLQDSVCPPTTNFAVFNRLQGKKRYRIYPNSGHGLGRQHWDVVWEWIRKEFDLSQD